MVGGSANAFTGKSRTRKCHYSKSSKKCKTILGYDTNDLYLYCSSQVMPYEKENHVKVKTAALVYNIKVLNSRLFEFAWVDVEVLKELYECLVR